MKEGNKRGSSEAGEAAIVVTRGEVTVAVEVERSGQSQQMLWRQN